MTGMTTLTEKQPALVGYDANDEPVIITAAELRLIARGVHEADDGQVQAMAKHITQSMRDAK